MTSFQESDNSAVFLAVPLLPQHEQHKQSPQDNAPQSDDYVDVESSNNSDNVVEQEPSQPRTTRPPLYLILLLLIVGALVGFGINSTRSLWSLACSNTLNDLLGFAILSLVTNMFGYLMLSSFSLGGDDSETNDLPIKLSCIFGTAMFFGACSMYAVESFWFDQETTLSGAASLAVLACLPWTAMMVWLVAPTRQVREPRGTVLPTVVV